MLSFGYTLLLHEAVAAVETAGLDAAVGFLHQARWGRPNLALDLMEEFRPLIVDAVVLRCATTGTLAMCTRSGARCLRASAPPCWSQSRIDEF
jgi:CRISPR-associated protein Cas1